jgi:uncharacterized protein (UPF0332 family)
MNPSFEPYLAKARESLFGAQSELANSRFNNAGNRAYYSAFQAAVAALIHAGVRRSRWYHEDVQALFATELTQRRKLYGSEFRHTVYDLYEVRIIADYQAAASSRTRVERAIRRADAFVRAVEERIT